MAGYDPFVELHGGTPIFSDGVAVTTEGVFPLVALVTGEITGSASAVASAAGVVIAGTLELVVSVSAVASAVGDARVTGEFIGWGIPIGF